MQKYIAALFFAVLVAVSAAAQKIDTDSLLKIINTGTEDSAKVRAYHVMASVTAGTDASAAINYAKKGIALGKKVNYMGGVAGCMFTVSYLYGLAGNLKSALHYIDTAIGWYLKVGKPDRLAMCYQTRADYKMQSGWLKASLLDCDTAIAYSEKAGKPGPRASAYKAIGNIYYLQSKYDQSKMYYEKAYEYYEKIEDSLTMAGILNKLGNIYEQKKEYDKSIESYEKALAMNTTNKHEVNFSEYYSNISNVWLKKGDKKKAEANALKAVAYARKQKNDLQLTKAQKMLSTIYLKIDSNKAAIKAASESFAIATGIESKYAQETSSDALAEGYYKTGDYKNAYHYLQISKRLNDSLAREKYDNEMAAMQTKFRVNEQDNEIRLLNKDKILQQQALRQQRFVLTGAVIIGALSLIGIWLFINRNRLRQQMKELQLRNQIAADLHDEVGSSISSIHMLSAMAAQQGNEAKRATILSTMSTNAKETMDKMGDIVWMIKPDDSEAGSLKERIERFVYDICGSKNIDVSIHLDDLEKIKFSMQQRKNLYLVFKEAINNAVKYSGTAVVDISAKLASRQLTMRVKDFGNGFDSSKVKKGNGLGNMQRRANELGARLAIQSEKGSGTLVELEMGV